MTIYTAGEAIGPAWQHAKALLFHNRRWGRILKLSLVALGAQLSLSFNSFSHLRPGSSGVPHAAVPLLVVFAVFATALSLAFGVALLYVGSRLQLVLFDIILLNDDRVGVAWRRHGHHTWRWAGIKLVGMVAIGILLSPLLIPALGGMFALVHAMGPVAGAPHPPIFNGAAVRALLLVFAQVFAVVMLFSLFFRLFLTVTQPVLALENASFSAVFRRAGRLVAADPAAMAVYAVVQLLVLFALGLCVLVVWAVATLVPAAVLGVAGWALWSLVHGSMPGLFLLGSVGAVAGVALLLWAMLSYVIALGVVIIFAETYAQYFMGGRYPLLGQYLQAPPLEPEPVLGFRD